MQNETGGPPTFEFTLPEGYELGKPQWPAPQRSITDYGDGFKILDHIYEKELTVVFPLMVPADAEPGSTAIIAADLDWVVCSDTCIFESGEVRLELPVASPGSEAKRSPEAALLERARKRHARPLPQENPPVTIRLTDDAATIRAAGAAAVVFYPADDGVPLAGLIDRGKVKGDTVKLPIADYATAEQRKAPLRGMLEVRSEPDGAPTFWQIDHPPGAGG